MLNQVCLLVVLFALVYSIIKYVKQSFTPVKHFSHSIRPFLLPSQVSIPRIMYKTGPKPYDQLPEHTILLHDNFLKANPYMTMVYYDDELAHDFINDHFEEEVLDAFVRLKPGAFKADLLRYCLLYELGGVYSDLSMELLVPLDQLVDFERDRLVLSCGLYSILCQTQSIEIAFMAAVPKLPVFRTAIDMVLRNVKNEVYSCNPLAMTGPLLFRRALDEHQDIPYRMEIEQKIDNKYVFMDDSTKIAIIPHGKNHRKAIKDGYLKKWLTRDVFAKPVYT